ncbi:MAG: glycosyltransferase family 39 protein [Gemmataceae bacterium]
MVEQPYSSRWDWSEAWPPLALMLLGGLMLVVRLGTLPYHGEESRRVQIAREMLHSGDFVVPRLQGHPWPTKPPLYYWLLAGVIATTGSLEPWVLRMPSALATLLTSALLAWYVRPTLGRWTAFATGFVFLSFGDILDSGCDAEIDATFTLWVTAALWFWHGGLKRGWSPTLCWMLGYGFTALAFLSKGLQGPVYFAAAAYGWLLLTGRGRQLLHPGHLLGLLLFTLMALAWMLPFAAQQGSQSLRAVFLSESVSRAVGGDWPRFVYHLWMFPAKWFGSLLPWSPLLLGYLLPWARQQVKYSYASTCFAGLALGLAFPTCWLPPGGEERYLRPVLPCVAVLVATLLHLLTLTDSVSSSLRWLWRGFLACWGVAAIVGGLALLAVSLLPAPPGRLEDWQEPWPVAAAFALLAGGIGVALLRQAAQPVQGSLWPWLLLIGLLASVCVTGLLTNRNLRLQLDSVAAVAALKERLGCQARLVSFGPVNHLFLLLYRQPIERLPWPHQGQDPQPDPGDYFCFDAFRGVYPPLPFVWEEVARLSMDRTHRPTPDNVVIVGRRLSSEETLARRGQPRQHSQTP